ncbi:MAG: hypothetical protein M5U26_03520 [Planctomycetota bacterium]|nr:hypothetical protein [Planctomycetota bacterium]
MDASAATLLSAGVFRRRDCRQVLVDASSAGVWRASYAGANAQAGGLCAGPLPNWADLPEADEGAQVTYVPATAERTKVIFEGAQAGKVYEVRARGLWTRDTFLGGFPVFPADETGEVGGATIGGADPYFPGVVYGVFCVIEPGAPAAPIEVGSVRRVLVTADGDLIGVFADNAGAFWDNQGEVAVRVREL